MWLLSTCLMDCSRVLVDSQQKKVEMQREVLSWSENGDEKKRESVHIVICKCEQESSSSVWVWNQEFTNVQHSTHSLTFVLCFVLNVSVCSFTKACGPIEPITGDVWLKHQAAAQRTQNVSRVPLYSCDLQTDVWLCVQLPDSRSTECKQAEVNFLLQEMKQQAHKSDYYTKLIWMLDIWMFRRPWTLRQLYL